jgi:hypothetical protein
MLHEKAKREVLSQSLLTNSIKIVNTEVTGGKQMNERKGNIVTY